MSPGYVSTYWPTPSANLLVDMLAERSTRIRLICRLIWQPRVGRHIGWHVDCVSADSVNQYLARGAKITQDPKSVLFLENNREGLKLSSKMALKLEMECEFPFGIFCPEKQDYLFRTSVAPWNFLLERPQKSASTCFPTGNGKQRCKWYKKKHFVNGKQPWSPRHTVKALFEGLMYGGKFVFQNQLG